MAQTPLAPPALSSLRPIDLIQPPVSAALLPNPVLGPAVQHRRHGEEEPEPDHAEVDCVAGCVAWCVWGLWGGEGGVLEGV